MSLKRAGGDISGAPPSKAGKNDGGGIAGGGAGGQESTDPIPRTFGLTQFTLHFRQRSWEEVGPGELWYLPLCQHPFSIFDIAMKKQWEELTNMNYMWELHQPFAKITNLMMLQDDLILQSGTPLETSVFTQANYLLHYSPTRQTEYFTLGNMPCGTVVPDPIEIDYEDKCEMETSYMKKLSDTYTNFENLTINPANIELSAGWVSGQNPRSDAESHEIKDTYFAPNGNNVIGNNYSANYQGEAPVVAANFHPTYARNLDKIKFHKYNDDVDLPITTNLNGVKLLKHPNNDPFRTRTPPITFQDTGTAIYNTKFTYPGQNRPYISRMGNFADNQPVNKNKTFANLQHHFFTMPPIKKGSNKELIKQRCSFLLEQGFDVTFYRPESIYNDNAGYFLEQKTAAILRPPIFGKQTPIINRPIICSDKRNIVRKADGEPCYFLKDDKIRDLADAFQKSISCYPEKPSKVEGLRFWNEQPYQIPVSCEDLEGDLIALNDLASSFTALVNLMANNWERQEWTQKNVYVAIDQFELAKAVNREQSAKCTTDKDEKGYAPVYEIAYKELKRLVQDLKLTCPLIAPTQSIDWKSNVFFC